MDLAEIVGRVAARPAAAAVFSDFDGTLAPIVAHPPQARALPAAVAALHRLAARGALAAVISGRPVDFLDPWFEPPVRLAGLYGLQRRVAGTHSVHPEAPRWSPVIAALADRARVELPTGVFVEPKAFSLTLHTRRLPSAEAEVVAFARREAERTGLELRVAKQSVELHPRIDVDKGTVIEEWSSGCDTVVYFGDDVGDLPAYAALARLRARGVTTLAVAVGGPELPAEVVAAADLVLAGPEAAAALLTELAGTD